MAEDSTFDILMARLRRGDEEAARQVFERFSRRLTALARSRLDAIMRQKVDPEDVMQSVFRSFFLQHAQGRFDFDGWDGLWSLLTVITLRKCGHKVGHFRAARRDVRREAAPPADEDAAAGWDAVAREPTPDEAAMLAETLGELLRDLNDRDRKIAELGLQGFKAPEISARVGCAERTVYRLLSRIHKRLDRLIGGNDGAAGA